MLASHVSPPDRRAPLLAPRLAGAAAAVAEGADPRPNDVNAPAPPADGLYTSLSRAVGRGWSALRGEVAAELQLRHLRNRSEGECQLVQLNRTASPDEIHSALLQDGAVIIRELIAPDVADLVRQELGEVTASQKDDGRLAHVGPAGSFVGDRTERTREFLHRSTAAQGLLTHPTVIGAMERLMGASCKRFRVKVATHIDIGPG